MAAPKHYGLLTKHGNKRVQSMVEVARRLPHTKRLTFVRRAMMLIAVKHGEVRERGARCHRGGAGRQRSAELRDMSALYTIVVQGEPKGEIYKHCGRWRWERLNNKGVQKYHRNATLQAVREQVARLCRVPVTDVRRQATNSCATCRWTRWHVRKVPADIADYSITSSAREQRWGHSEAESRLVPAEIHPKPFGAMLGSF